MPCRLPIDQWRISALPAPIGTVIVGIYAYDMYQRWRCKNEWNQWNGGPHSTRGGLLGAGHFVCHGATALYFVLPHSARSRPCGRGRIPMTTGLIRRRKGAGEGIFLRRLK
jgi:hypothetical protein